MNEVKTNTWKIEVTDFENTTVSWESSKWDSTASNLVEAFAGLLIAQTFASKSVYEAMKNLAEEQLRLCENSD